MTLEFPRILVIGATGRLGGYLRAVWPDGAARWQTRGPDQGTGWTKLDLLEQPDALYCAAQGVGTILCLAGGVPGRGRLEDNTPLALATVKAAARVGASAIIASTAAVYGRPETESVSEESRIAPISPYGHSKYEMECRAAELAAQLSVSVTSLRIGNIAGADACLGGWKPGFVLDRFPSGSTPRRSYMGPVSFAQTLLKLCDAPDLPGVLNIAAPGAVEMGALLDAAGLDWTPRPAPDNAIETVELDVTRLCALVDMRHTSGSADRIVEEWKAICA